MQVVPVVRHMLALTVSFALLSDAALAQPPDVAARIHARLSKLPRNAEIEVRLQNKSRVRGHLVRFDRRELVLAGHTNPIPLADVKSLKELKPPRQGPAWNPLTGFISSWKQAVIVGGLLVGVVVLVKTNTR